MLTFEKVTREQAEKALSRKMQVYRVTQTGTLSITKKVAEGEHYYMWSFDLTNLNNNGRLH